MSNFALFKGKMSNFSYFTYNQGKIFLILPISRGGAYVYLVSIGSLLPPRTTILNIKFEP